MRNALRFVTLALIASSSCSAFAISYNIDILYPDSETKTFLLVDKQFSLPLKHSKWQCMALKENEMGEVICQLQGSKAATAMTLPCKGNHPMAAGLHVYDNQEKDHKILISCNMH